jgi:uncharacterized protein YejL (UPF0352 family)
VFAQLLGMRWLMYAISALVGATMLGGAYWVWKNKIENNAQLKYNNEQLEQVIKEQTEYIEKSKAVAELQAEVIRNNIKEREALNRELEQIQEYINSPEAATSDRPSSEVIKETIRQLRKL